MGNVSPGRLAAGVRAACSRTIIFGSSDQDRQTAQAAIVHVIMRSGYLVERIACRFEIIEHA